MFSVNSLHVLQGLLFAFEHSDKAAVKAKNAIRKANDSIGKWQLWNNVIKRLKRHCRHSVTFVFFRRVTRCAHCDAEMNSGVQCSAECYGVHYCLKCIATQFDGATAHEVGDHFGGLKSYYVVICSLDSGICNITEQSKIQMGAENLMPMQVDYFAHDWRLYITLQHKDKYLNGSGAELFFSEEIFIWNVICYPFGLGYGTIWDFRLCLFNSEGEILCTKSDSESDKYLSKVKDWPHHFELTLITKNEWDDTIQQYLHDKDSWFEAQQQRLDEAQFKFIEHKTNVADQSSEDEDSDIDILSKQQSVKKTSKKKLKKPIKKSAKKSAKKKTAKKSGKKSKKKNAKKPAPKSKSNKKSTAKNKSKNKKKHLKSSSKKTHVITETEQKKDEMDVESDLEEVQQITTSLESMDLDSQDDLIENEEEIEDSTKYEVVHNWDSSGLPDITVETDEAFLYSLCVDPTEILNASQYQQNDYKVTSGLSSKLYKLLLKAAIERSGKTVALKTPYGQEIDACIQRLYGTKTTPDRVKFQSQCITCFYKNINI